MHSRFEKMWHRGRGPMPAINEVRAALKEGK